MGAETEAERARAERLEAELATVTRRLLDVEQARADSARTIAVLSAEAEAARRDRGLFVSRIFGPLVRLERGVRWLGEKAGLVAGLVARQVIFRARGGPDDGA